MSSTRERVPFRRDRESDYTHEAAATPRAFAKEVTGNVVLDPLAVSPAVMRTVHTVARLGDLGVTGVLLTACRNGVCCAEFRALLEAPVRPGMPALAVHSRTDAIVDWRACLHPHAQCVEIDGSHCRMAVNPHVDRELERLLDRSEETPCSR